MKTKISDKLEQILKNKTLGSTEIVSQLNESFKAVKVDHYLVEKLLPEIKKKLGHFTAVIDYVNDLKSILSLKDSNMLLEFFNNYSEKESVKYEKIFKKFYKSLHESNRIITLSRSGTLLNVFKLWHKKNKKLSVVVCESRPMLEGKLFAKDLVKFGIKVELITDSMMSLYVPKVDAAIIGTDSILKNRNVINKTGSKSLALLCKEYKIPFYVATTQSKLSNKKIFKPKKENPSEVWNKKNNKLVVSNIYFEEIEKNLITKIFTE